MTTVAIITEYNPFHNGHKHQIDKIRDIFGENTNIICIMSGNFVQRGDFSIFDKHTRAKCAVLGGANLIFELPLAYALSSAEFFARGAISILNQLKIVDYLCFGSECGDIDTLYNISCIMNTLEFQEKLKSYIKTGISYPNALDNALYEYDENFSEIIKNPNNTLGIEYIKTLLNTKSLIKPMTITRKSTGYHSDFEKDNIASASYIRNKIDDDIFHLMPENCAKELENIPKTYIQTAENSILTHLKRKNSDFFTNIRDCNEGLEHKIVTSLKTATTLPQLVDKIKSKRYTNSRINRIILNSYLEIPKEYTEIEPKYAKVLAFDDVGRKILKKLKEIDFPIIVKPAFDYNLCSYGKKLFSLDVLATDIYYMANEDLKNRIGANELCKSPVYVRK